MTLERDIKFFILRALRQARKEPLLDETLRASIQSAFPHVGLTAGELGEHIGDCQRAGWIAGTHDELLGLVWTLTTAGTIRAQNLP